MKKFLSVCIKFPAALALGCIVALGIMQNDPWLKTKIERQMISSIGGIIGEALQVTVTEIDLLRGELVMRQVRTQASDGEWSFYAPVMRISLSWLSWFSGKGFDADVAIEQPQVLTTYQKGSFAVQKPLYDLARAPLSLPINFKNYRSDNGYLTIRAPYGEMTTKYSSFTTLEPRSVITRVWCSGGKAFYKDALFAHQAQGQVIFDVPYDGTPYTVTVKVGCTRPTGRSSLKDVPYHLYYRNASQRGLCRWRAEDGSLAIQVDGITSTPQELIGSVSLVGHLGEIASYGIADVSSDMQGTGSFEGTVKATETEYVYAGSAAVENACLAGMSIEKATISLEGTDKQVNATIDDAQSLGMDLKGTVRGVFEPQSVTGELLLTKPYTPFPHCVVSQGCAKVVYKDSKVSADITGEGSFFKRTSQLLRGRLKSDLKTAHLKGTCGGNPVDLEVALNPVVFKKVNVKDTLQNPRLDLEQHALGLKGKIDGTLIKVLLEALTGHQLSGSLQAEIVTKATDRGTQIDLKVQDASLKIPGTYTVIQEISGTIDITSTDRRVVIKDLQVKFHKGFAWASYATFCFNENGALESAHIPFQCQELLVSKHKDLFGTLSGGITAIYGAGRWRCEGLLTLENAHVRSNVLSAQVQRDLFGGAQGALSSVPKVDLAIKVQSRTPIKVATSFLSADGYIDLLIGGTIEQPAFTGTLDLVWGQLNFPYKPLVVTSGKLVLSPEADGPTINLTAKNKIRAYTVTLRVTGSLAQPTIVFESTPQLPEESIMTLLLAGSDQGSLLAAMPRMVMQQIESLLFGSEESLSKTQQILKGLLMPLKNVRLIKKDDSQEQLQAVLEVDINDRLRAKAQNNLQLSDETQLELEYVVSDDVTVKAIRDKSGTLGGEVEMRWKF